LLNGSLHEDAGEYYIPAQWRMGQVAQDMPETDQSATDFVIEGDTVLLDARAEVAAAEATRRRRPHGPRLHGAARRR
jgi:ATP-binding cassette subfamily F protein 3